MKTAGPLFLEDDTWAHIGWIAARMGQRDGRQVSRSEVVEWLVRKHAARVMKAQQSRPRIVA